MTIERVSIVFFLVPLQNKFKFMRSANQLVKNRRDDVLDLVWIVFLFCQFFHASEQKNVVILDDIRNRTHSSRYFKFHLNFIILCCAPEPISSSINFPPNSQQPFRSCPKVQFTLARIKRQITAVRFTSPPFQSSFINIALAVQLTCMLRSAIYVPDDRHYCCENPRFLFINRTHKVHTWTAGIHFLLISPSPLQEIVQ